MKGRWNKALSLLVTAAMTVSLCAAGAQAAAYGAEPVRVIVEMEDAAVLESAEARAAGASAYARTEAGTAAAARLVSAQKALQQRIVAEADRNAEVVYTYTSVFNGFSLQTDAAGVSAIRAMEGVKNVYPVRVAQITDPEPDGGADDEIAADGSGMLPSAPDIGLEAMWDMGYDGRGQVIAVIDSELDVTHPMFAGEVEDGALTLEGLETLLAENTFNIDASAKRLYRSSKLPFVYDYYDHDTDTYNGNFDAVHGTHVSGIAAGRNGTLDGESVSGMAPQAQVVFMKTANENGGLPDDVCIAAIDDAAKLGVCAINMSFGVVWECYDAPYEKAIAAAKAAGILLSMAAGNSGRGESFGAWADMPDYDASGIPGCITGAFSVAAYEPAYQVMNYYAAQFRRDTEETAQVRMFGEDGARAFAKAFSDGEYPYVYCGQGYADEIEGLDLAGKIALILRGGRGDDQFTFAAKAENAAAAGAVGVIFVNTDDTAISSSLGVESLPYVMVTRSTGEAMGMADLGDGGWLQTDARQHGDRIPSPNGGTMCDFSSWGTNITLELKPEITAPGGQIYSSVPDEGYESWNGTSMAAPHVTGAAALLNSYINDHWADRYSAVSGDYAENRALLMENLMMTSAGLVPQDETLPASPRQQGAGLLNLAAAVETPVLITGTEHKAKISLREIGSSFTLDFTVENFSDQEVTYTPSLFVFTDDAAYDEDYDAYWVTGSRGLTYETELPEAITVPAGETAEVSIPVTLDEAELAENMEVFTNGFFVDGFVVLTPQDDSPQLSVPYTGFYGGWTSQGALTENSRTGATVLLCAGSGWEICRWDGNSLEEHSCAPLGQNQLLNWLTDGMGLSLEELGLSAEEAEDYAGGQFAGLSPNDDGVLDALCVAAKFWRDVDDVIFTILDDGGQVYQDPVSGEVFAGDYEELYGPTMRMYWRCMDYFSEEGSYPFPDGDYTAVVSCRVSAEGAAEETVRLPFYVDTQAPEVASVKLRTEDGKTYLDVSASDNRYLMGVMLAPLGSAADFDAAANSRVLNTASASVTFDVTGADFEQLELQVTDYAGNMTAQLLSEAVQGGESGGSGDSGDSGDSGESGGGGGGGSSTPTYSVSVNAGGNGSVTVSPKRAEEGETVTVTVSPKPGYSLKSLTAVEKDGTALDLADLGGGKYAFLMPAGKVTVTAEWETVSTVRHTFTDVSADAYYADAVAWAVEKGITSGTGESTFSPDADCTRAQIVTLLWRAAGSPVVNYAMDFADVSDDAYYAEAVRWAVSEGITGGTGALTFSPDATCTRAQAVAFLYRGEQASFGGMQGEWMFRNPFDDVDLESYYGEAVMWAVANGVTTGTGEATFSPHSGCTRGQIVTLLHRALGE